MSRYEKIIATIAMLTAVPLTLLWVVLQVMMIQADSFSWAIFGSGIFMISFTWISLYRDIRKAKRAHRRHQAWSFPT